MTHTDIPEPDKRSFILGMITAFSECVAGGCKRLALSPPLTHADYEMIAAEANELIEKHGLLHYHEENPELPEAERFDWILIAGKQETLDRYLALRRNGKSPAVSLEPFHSLLSYQPDNSIHTGFDAYRTRTVVKSHFKDGAWSPVESTETFSFTASNS